MQHWHKLVFAFALLQHSPFYIDLPKITIDFRLAILGQLLLRRGTNEIMAIYDRFDHVDRH